MADKKGFRVAHDSELDALQGVKADARGVRCKACGCADFYVKETTRRKDGTISRRRQCRHCGKRITTREETVR
jgi:hypothetical protein